MEHDPNHETQQQRTADPVGQSTRIFAGHVKQYLLALPWATVAVTLLTLAIALLDLLLRLVTPQQNAISQWLYMDMASVVQRWQVHRLLTYPLATPGLSLWITNALLLVPYMAAMERKQGTLRLAYLLGVVFTLGVSLLLVGSLAWFDSPSFLQSCSGLSGWVVALAFWSAKEDEAEGVANDRMLFGVLRVPGRFMPLLVLVFYFFLVPGTSLLTHLFSAALAYCYASKRLPERLLLSDDAIRQGEQKAWLKPVVSASRFVPLEAASRDYLPIAHSAGLVSGFSTASSAGLSAPSSTAPQAPFPGEGRRLGDV